MTKTRMKIHQITKTILVCISMVCMTNCSTVGPAASSQSLGVCVWRHGDDGLTLILADAIEDRLTDSEKYHLGCADGPPISLHILQIDNWKEVDERFWMISNAQLRLGEALRKKKSVACWDDEVNKCVDAIYQWLERELPRLAK